MKAVQSIYRAGYTDYDGLATYRVMPTRNIPIDGLDPFLFLNHHGPQQYGPNNAGLPFGPHPHRGFETVTLIMEGELVHQDSTGFSSNIKAGGVQWMTAGSGIIHSELSSETFRAQGGTVEILQLWINLPSWLKNTAPNYIGLKADQIPVLSLNEGSVRVRLISGAWGETKAPIQSLTDVPLSIIEITGGSVLELSAPAEHTVLFYLINGHVKVNGEEAEVHELVEFRYEGTSIQVQAMQDTVLLFGHAMPYREPVVAHGPFVMNTPEEIRQAFVDYQQGKFGVWPH